MGPESAVAGAAVAGAAVADAPTEPQQGDPQSRPIADAPTEPQQGDPQSRPNTSDGAINRSSGLPSDAILGLLPPWSISPTTMKCWRR